MNEQMACDGANTAKREKMWAELTDAEKIERMRDQVKQLARLVQRHDSGIYQMQEHRHGNDGELLVPLNSRRGLAEAAYRRGDEWF